MSIRCFYASQPDFRSVAGGQDHISQLDLRKFPQDFPGLVSKTRCTTQSGQSFPKHIGQEANQNMRLDAFFFLVPYRANAQITFMDPESILRLRQLYVCLS